MAFKPSGGALEAGFPTPKRATEAMRTVAKGLGIMAEAASGDDQVMAIEHLASFEANVVFSSMRTRPLRESNTACLLPLTSTSAAQSSPDLPATHRAA